MVCYYYEGRRCWEDKAGYVKVYTDGACSGNGTPQARAGLGVFFGNNHPLNVSQRVQGRQTSNVAEIQAVTVAAYQAQKAGIPRLKIYTDSKFLINSITKWLPKWKRNGWLTTKGTPVVNRDDFEEMEDALDELEDVLWYYVQSHNGTHGNEMADRFAREVINHDYY